MNGNGSDDAGEPIAEALRLLNLFASVGAEAFDITHTNLQQEKRGFRPAQSLAQARQSMPYLVPSAARRQNNLIVRPRAGDGVTLVCIPRNIVTQPSVSRARGNCQTCSSIYSKGMVERASRRADRLVGEHADKTPALAF
jgi:hypothetical protein